MGWLFFCLKLIGQKLSFFNKNPSFEIHQQVFMTRKVFLYAGITAVLALILYACSSQLLNNRKLYKDQNALIHSEDELIKNKFLKAHLQNGELALFQSGWEVDSVNNEILGIAKLYDINRVVYPDYISKVNINDVALFETNKDLTRVEKKAIGAVTILTVANASLVAVCLVNPKACFGSCPTFYTGEDDNIHYANAEGFSNAILPSFEYSDIDALGHASVSGGAFSLTMKNEALETHCIKDLQLLALPKKAGVDILHSYDNRFYSSSKKYSITKCNLGQEVQDKLSEGDKLEYMHEADPENLAAKHEIEFEFNNVWERDLGLEITFRQGFLTTYLIYSAMGYMGDEFSDYLAETELDLESKGRLKNGIKKELGNIDVYLWDYDQEAYKYQGGFNETGPIAFNQQLLPFNKRNRRGKVKVKLVLNKGLWRIDEVALRKIDAEVYPERINPHAVSLEGKESTEDLNALLNDNKYLVSMPGNAYKIDYSLAANEEGYELFLESTGYYLEWMRPAWLKEKNKLKLYEMVYHPAHYLRSEAEQYKAYEAQMEYDFWNSKVNTNEVSLYEY